MSDGVLISERMAQELVRDHWRIAQLAQNRGVGRGLPHYDIPEPPLLVKNNNAGAVPAYGLVQPTGTVTLSGEEVILTVDKPSTTFSRLILVNGPDPIPSGATQPVQRGPHVYFAYDSGAPALGDGWGPKASQWTATKNYPAALSPFGVTDSTNKIAYGRLQPINAVIGVLGGTLNAGLSATVDIQGGAGGSEGTISSLTLTGQDYFLASGSIASGNKVGCIWVNGIWYVFSTSC